MADDMCVIVLTVFKKHSASQLVIVNEMIYVGMNKT